MSSPLFFWSRKNLKFLKYSEDMTSVLVPVLQVQTKPEVLKQSEDMTSVLPVLQVQTKPEVLEIVRGYDLCPFHCSSGLDKTRSFEIVRGYDLCSPGSSV